MLASFVCGSTVCITEKYADIRIFIIIIIITIVFFELEPLCVPLYSDFRHQLKKSIASLDVFFLSFISSSTANPFDFEENQLQGLL